MGKKTSSESSTTSILGVPVKTRTKEFERETTFGIPHGPTQHVKTTTEYLPRKKKP